MKIGTIIPLFYYWDSLLSLYETLRYILSIEQYSVVHAMNSTKFAFISPKVLNIYQRTFSLGIAKTFGLWHWGGGGGGGWARDYSSDESFLISDFQMLADMNT